ncbi:MAG TPA: zinc ribbon domain-containing protein [Burkholderiales bacterium]|nr:zinc ribbon domain-containing protein [Burkholderiales bacterium]
MAKYRVVIKGIREGTDHENLLIEFADLFKRDAQALRPVLTAKYFVVWRSLEKTLAADFQLVLEGMGFVCEIEAEQSPELDGFPAQRSQGIEGPTSSPSSTSNVSGPRFCPQCGTSVTDRQKFCAECGMNLARDNLKIV